MSVSAQTGEHLSSRARIVLNAVTFQVAWLLIVLGGDAVALGTTVVVLGCHWMWMSREKQEWFLIAAVPAMGFVVDSVYINLGVLPIPAQTIFSLAVAPIWLVCLWVCFATTLLHSLYFLSKRLKLCALLSACGGAWAYYCGTMLHDIQLPWTSLIVLSLWWGCWVPAFFVLQKTKLIAPASES